MRVLSIVLIAALPGIAAAQSAEIEEVIGDQLDAFLADDFGRAFEFASPMIRGMFQTPENFGQMVRQGYPMVHRPADVQYLDLEGDGLRLRQRVMIRDGAGIFHMLEYEMIEGPDGWKINGVRVLNAPQVGA